MKILLLTDIPPCKNYTAGLVLKPLVRFLPLDQIVMCTVSHPALEFKIPPELEKIPHLKLFKFIEKMKSGGLVAYILELFNAIRIKYYLLPKIIKFAKEHKVDTIWVVLQGQTIVRLARPLAKKLSVSLFTQVWDSFEWWLRACKTDKLTQKRLLIEFDKVLKYSTCCATASWGMSEEYEAKYNIPTIPVIAGLPKESAKLPAVTCNNTDEYIISIAGQFYAKDEWLCLVNALNRVNWKIADKNIKIRVMGGDFEILRQQSPTNFEYLGWHSQEETIKLLAESDLLYMPYWFSEEFYKESCTSFPGKLVTYFVSGRPVFCHAPLYSSPSKYIMKYNAGYICDSLDTNKIISVLEKAITDKESYSIFAQNGHNCFLQDFTLERMKETFFKFLGINGSK